MSERACALASTFLISIAEIISGFLNQLLSTRAKESNFSAKSGRF